MRLGLVMALVSGALCLADESTCPEDCECHLLDEGWVTDCSEANLTQVPSSLSQVTKTLIMDGNFLTELVEPLNAPALAAAHLAKNKIANLSREAFSELTNLVMIDLSGNEISYIDPETFVNNTNLQRLELQSNPVKEVDNHFFIAHNLTNLDLRDCGLKSLSDSFFQQMQALEKLDLSGNPIQSLDNGALSPLVNLVYLKLNRCNLTFIAHYALSNLNSLKSLELTENHFGKSINWVLIFGSLPLLENLDLTASGISNLPEDSFSGNTLMKSLNLSNNGLSGLDVATTLGKNLRHLKFLNLSYCQLSGPLSQDAFLNATKLETLILNGNHMKAEDLTEALTPLVHLHKLSLRNCTLTHLPNDTFHRLSSLKELDISHNPLSEAFTSLLSPLQSLEHLDMSYSNLHHINDSTFSKMTSLKTLILSGNPLKIIDPGLFSNLTLLKVLELNECGLSSLKSTVFLDDFTHNVLEELRLSKNPLEVPESGTFLPKQLKRLHILDLSNCNISRLSSNAFSQFNNLSWISLKGNKLTESSLSFLLSLPNLKSIDLSNNNLKHITPSNLRNNKQVIAIKLAGNPWRCGCYVKEMWGWAKNSQGEIQRLVGARAEDKRRAPLTCQFHWAGPPGRRPSSGTLTWGRFARDPEACSSPRPRRSPAPCPLSSCQPFMNGQDLHPYLLVTCLIVGLIIVFLFILLIRMNPVHKRVPPR